MKSAQRRPSAASGAPRIPFALLVVALVVCGLALLLMLNTASAANELERHDLAARDAGISAEVQQARIEVARRAAPQNLARAAAALGMVPAGSPAFLQFDADGKLVRLGTPNPVTGPPPPPAPAPAPATAASTAPAPAVGAPNTASPPAPPAPGTPVAPPTPPPTPGPPPAVPITALPGGTR